MTKRCQATALQGGVNEFIKRFFFTLVLTLCAHVVCFAQDAASKQIYALTTEVEQQLSTQKIGDDLRQQCTKDVSDARAYLKLNNPYLSLYTIRSCQIELASQNFAASKSDLAKKGAEALEEEWRQLGSSLTEREKKISTQGAKSLPAVVAAIADVSQIQVKQYYQSGRLFALNGNMSEGIYYLGRAPANLDFAIFCRSLKFPEPKKPIEFRSPAPELTKLGTAALRTYKSADVTTQQPQFNRLNSNLKIAEELNSASKFEAALLKYLESELYFGLIISSAEKEDLEHLRGRSKELGKALTSNKTDNSIGVLFWEMAERALNPVGADQPTPAQLKRAVVILDRVLPSYADYMKGLQK